MRIVFVPHVYSPVHGGAQQYCRRVAETLAASGNDTHVVTADLASAEGYYRFDVGPIGKRQEAIARVEVYRVPFAPLLRRIGAMVGRGPEPSNAPQRAVMSLARRVFRRRLARRLRSLAPDVVVTLPHLFVNVRAVLDLQRRHPIPLVLVPVLHEFDPYWPVAEMREAVTLADAVVALTEDEARRLVDRYGADPGRVVISSPGADPAPSAPGPPVAPVRLLYVGRLAPAKGLDLLRAAMDRVWTARPDVELTLAGSPDAGWDDAAWRDSPARIVLEPSEIEKRRLVATSHCLILPSKHEAFGLVILEAWSSGRPVIAMDVPVIAETVRSGVDGILVEPDSPAALERAIVEMIEDPDGTAAMGVEGLRRVGERYTWDRAAGAMLDAAQRAVRHHHGRGTRSAMGPIR